MNSTDTPADTAESAPAPDALENLAQLAENAAGNPQTSAPLRELMPALVAVLRHHAEALVLLGA